MRGTMLRGLALVAGVLALMLTVVAPYGAAATVAGFVTDVNDVGIPNAQVTLRLLDQTTTAVTRADGFYEISLPAGDYVRTAKALGFFSRSLPVSVPEEGRVVHDISLAAGSAADFASTTTVRTNR